MSKPQSIAKTHIAQKTNITNNHKSTKKTKNKKSWKTNRRKNHLQVSASETMEQERESMKKKFASELMARLKKKRENLLKPIVTDVKEK